MSIGENQQPRHERRGIKPNEILPVDCIAVFLI